ncbi:hypothetical protein FFLO_00252 [Filobasidium floriforme]|uniref:Uncharacterized protein n=1 Tax=Filobasidium floriforme TaxID=5210 RepID=A0A8K0NVT8_9TREE|nr:uncharacterized protein HD553DRAFT_357796 [Filobasidium floriforme]KAG7575433.1 hypothetical protein FFLO_00252 [Filobasidium floriforme]KAH8082568.1 hypothetical protein HD553DRAFT_357796 [Filobasidium floriforme]
MTRPRRKSSNNSSKYSWGAGSCSSGASTVVDHSDRYDSVFYTDHASFSQDSSSSSTLHRLLTKISSLFSSDRSGTISDIPSTEGIPLPKGTRGPSHNRLQRRSTQRKLISEALDSYAASNLTNTSLSGESVATRRADTFEAYAASREKKLTKKQLKEKAKLDRAESKRLQQEARKKEKESVKKAKKETKESKRRERRRITKAAPTRRPPIRRADFAVSAEIVPQVPISSGAPLKKRYYA